MDKKRVYSKIRNSFIFKITFSVLICVSLYVLFDFSYFQNGVVDCYNYVVTQVVDQDTSPQIYINGISTSKKTKDEMKKILTQEDNLQVPDININVTCNGETAQLTTQDFDYKWCGDEILDLAYLNDSDNALLKYELLFLMSKGKISFTVMAMPTVESVNKVVQSLTDKFNDPMQEAIVESFKPLSEKIFTYKEGKNGQEIDSEELKSQIINIIEDGGKGSVLVTKAEKKCKSTVSELQKKTQLVSEFATNLSSNAPRNNNIKIALSYVNGKVLQPGEIFSFNKTVGNCGLASRGFLQAPIISNGELVMGNGGGICQAATTAYGAAIRANMKIVERYNHSIRSSYVPIGQDASISYNSADFKFKNTSASPIYIAAYINGKKAVCKIYGARETWYDDVKVVSGIIGDTGLKAYAQRVFYKNGIEVKREYLPSSSYKK